MSSKHQISGQGGRSLGFGAAVFAVCGCISFACSSSDSQGVGSGGVGGAPHAGSAGQAGHVSNGGNVSEGGSSGSAAEDAGAAGVSTEGGSGGAAPEGGSAGEAAEGGAAGSLGSSGAGGDLGEGGAGPLECGTGAGSVNQSQLASNGNIVISPTQVPGQTFTVTTTGILTGIELGLAACNDVDANASVLLTLSRNGTTLATASKPATQLSTSECSGNPLDANTVGANLFDLSAQCVSVSANDVLTATLSIVGPSATCDENTHHCVGSFTEKFCFDAYECQFAARAGMTGNVYANGHMVVNGNASDGNDLSFKVFVR